MGFIEDLLVPCGESRRAKAAAALLARLLHGLTVPLRGTIIETEAQYTQTTRGHVHAAARLAEYLSSRRLKMTRERREILGQVLSLRGHFDADHLLVMLHRSGCNVSRATLYRTLAVLVEAGLVHRLEMARGQARYEPMVGRHHHDHMVCLSCGGIIEFESREIERLQEQVCRRKRFLMTGHTHQILGYCAACSQRERRSAADAPKVARRPSGYPEMRRGQGR